MRWLLLLLLLICCNSVLVRADGNVGCLFSEALCTDKVEWCYDDYAFGKCLQLYGNVEEEDLIRHELTTEELRGFEKELKRLLLLGYRWSHAYTQCILQAMLYATKNNLHYDRQVCDHLMDQDLKAAALNVFGEENFEPQPVASVKFTPNSDVEPSNFADEIYYPPEELDYLEDIDSIPNEQRPNEREREFDYDDWLKPIKRSFRRMGRSSGMRNEYEILSKMYNNPGDYRDSRQVADSPVSRLIEEDIEDVPSDYFASSTEDHRDRDNSEYLYNLPARSSEQMYFLKPENEEELRSILSHYQMFENGDNEFFNADDGNLNEDSSWENYDLDKLRAALYDLNESLGRPRIDPYYDSQNKHLYEKYLKPERFNEYYNTPEKFRQGYETRDDSEIYSKQGLPFANDQTEKASDRDDVLENAAAKITENEEIKNENENARLARLFNMWRYAQNGKHPASQRSGAFTEGGVVYLDESSSTDEPNVPSPDLNALLNDYEWGFRRNERLDVKKPGPPFDTKNQYFKQDIDRNQTDFGGKPVKKELHGQHAAFSDKDHESYDVDSSYAYVGFKDSIRTWKEGAQVVRAISDLLHLEPSTFSYPRVDRNEVTFKVEENSKNLNASEVAKRINDIKDELRRELNVEVTSAGVGDKAKLPAVLKLNDANSSWNLIDWGENGTFNLALVLAGVAAIIFSVGVLVASHFYYRRRKKLAHLSTGDTEPSQDYQDLCRARMSGKWQSQSTAPEKSHPEKQEVAGQRITSLSRESDNNSPSTRSSTSSWSEEPALTNMDISTGHMVLTYMEDHLKNKDRLEQEWQALCAYEAEPSATTAAENPDNIKKNRNPEVLPYDHSRVVLNDVTNINSVDYINASTITDHDPRNPAYIAAQGPLAHTAPDFWQMVWEQGSVVMVMLTRLTEGGISMCHRYWPEEGSDLYHIYEVHLVSEHIWCDDYLVRSFYLKNLKTGETRTVTQFHFLSWPDRGIPSSTKALLEFRRKVNKSYRGRSCPIVVHCSDGASRTGTYCLIDMVLNRMAKGAKEIDIAATLEHIRDQRPHMVTTKQQFEFVLMAVAEEVHAILKALPAQLQQQHEKREKESAEKDKQDKDKPEK